MPYPIPDPAVPVPDPVPDPAPDPAAASRLKLRLLLGPSAMLGPGKAELLDRIAAAGSIAAAGRGMGMSYKRAWSLVEEMNAAFAGPLVGSNRGGAGGGGAHLTDLGAQVLGLYRAIEAAAAAAAARDLAMLAGLLAPASGDDTATGATAVTNAADPASPAGDMDQGK